LPESVTRDAVELLLDWHENPDNAEVAQRISNWRAANPLHEQAWQHIEAVNSRIQPLAAAPAKQLSNVLLQSEHLTRRRLLKGGLTLALLAGVGGIAWRSQLWTTNRPVQLFTGSGERKQIFLDNGPQITLGGNTRLQYRRIQDSYQLQLLAGEILITTRPGAATPHSNTTPRLQVLSQNLTLTPVGTRFAVRQDNNQTRVAVYQGSVLAHSPVLDRHIQLDSGSAASFDAAGHYGSAELIRGEDAWERGLVIASDMPLKDLIAILNRHHSRQISYEPGLANLKISGTYPLEQSDEVLAALEAVLPLQVQIASPREIILTHKPSY
jgi:transmembrane sensor